eukprot:1151643-Pelagomonas_calceolata.AAC.3
MAFEVFEILFGSQVFNFFKECATQVWDRACLTQMVQSLCTSRNSSRWTSQLLLATNGLHHVLRHSHLPTTRFRLSGLRAEKEERSIDEKESKMKVERPEIQAFNSKQIQAQSACQLWKAVPSSLLLSTT